MRIRKDNDIKVLWAIERGSNPENMETATDVVLTMIQGYSTNCDIAETVIQPTSIADNVLTIEIPKEQNSVLGAMRLKLEYTVADPEMADGERKMTVDKLIAVIVESTELADTTGEFAVTSDAAIGFEGRSAFEVWLIEYPDKTLEDYFDWLQQPATDAAALANDAATLANEKAGLADTAATLANEKAGLADAAATLANTKAALADEKAGLADAAATLANNAADLATTAASLHKGYFTSTAALNTAYPSPTDGQIAYVADIESSTGFYIYNAVGGAWVASTVEAPAVEAPLSEYTPNGGSTKTAAQLDSDIAQLAGDVVQKSAVKDVFVETDAPIELYASIRSDTTGIFTNYAVGTAQTLNETDVTITIPTGGATSLMRYFPTGRNIEGQKTYRIDYNNITTPSATSIYITSRKNGIYTSIGYTSSGVPRKIVRQQGVAGTQTDMSGVIKAMVAGDSIRIIYRDGVTSMFLNGDNVWNHSEVLDGELAITIGGFATTNYTYSVVADYVGDYVKGEIEKVEKVYPRTFFQYSHANQTFYVFSHISGDKYGRASIVRETNLDLYLDYWRLKQIDGYSYNAETGVFMNNGTLLLSVGENECVWRRSALSDDFTGGFHGDEKYQMLQILVDGVAIELPTADIALTKCDSFRYIVHSEMYKTAQSGVTDHAIECYHVKVTEIENGGYKTFNRLTWAVGGSLSLWYAGISCVGKVCATQVATDYDFVPIPYTGAEGAVPEFTGFREMHAYNATSKYSAKVTSKIIKPSAQDATAVMFIADRGVDSKYYRRLSGYNPVVGEVWESEMIVSYGVMG